jgi:hypothetical protein
MTANELRIGNYVYFHGDVEEINMVDGFGVIGREEQPSYSIDEFEPIPLTEEWILKFEGFFKDGEHLSIGRYDYKYCFKYRDWADNWAFYIEYTDSPNSNDDGVKYPIAFDIKYVHQLQNLYFALTGEELIFNPLERIK